MSLSSSFPLDGMLLADKPVEVSDSFASLTVSVDGEGDDEADAA